ncbi:ATP-binding cassette domain-containing protein, partial [Acinetobacter baumannii]
VACHHSDHVGVINFKELDHQVIERETDREALLKVEHINAWYGQQQALFDISFQLKKGECLALVGESGSGKTTLSRVIAGLNENA